MAPFFFWGNYSCARTGRIRMRGCGRASLLALQMPLLPAIFESFFEVIYGISAADSLPGGDGRRRRHRLLQERVWRGGTGAASCRGFADDLACASADQRREHHALRRLFGDDGRQVDDAGGARWVAGDAASAAGGCGRVLGSRGGRRSDGDLGAGGSVLGRSLWAGCRSVW